MLKSNKRERKVQQEYLKKGYEVYSRGWPDFLMYHQEKDELVLIEVKRKQKRPTQKMGLSKYQQRVIEILRHKGIKVEVVYVE